MSRPRRPPTPHLFLCAVAWADAIVPILRMRKPSLWKVEVSPKVPHCGNQAYREVVGRGFPLCQAAFNISLQIPRAAMIHSAAPQSSSQAWGGVGKRGRASGGKCNWGKGQRRVAMRAGPESSERREVKYQIANFQNKGSSQSLLFIHTESKTLGALIGRQPSPEQRFRHPGSFHPVGPPSPKSRGHGRRENRGRWDIPAS